MSDRRPGRRLFRKYVVVLLFLVGGVLLISSGVDLYFSYQDAKKALVLTEREKAVAAAARIENFIKDIEGQLRAYSQAAFDDPTIAAREREIDFLRVLRNVPAVTEIRHLDVSGTEQVRVGRFTLDAVRSGLDLSREPGFLEARQGRTYFGPVYFRNESEPYMTVAVPAGDLANEVIAAEVNLKAIWDVVSQIGVGAEGYAYVVDARGNLVAHPDISLVLQKRDLSGLPQVRNARAVRATPASNEVVATVADGLQGGQVLTAYADIASLEWLVFVERPLVDAFAPLQASIVRSAVIFALGLALSVLASVVLAKRMIAPIRVLQAGAARIGTGELGHRIDIRTGDELQALGEEFNRTAAQLEESYATLERKVEARTRELAEANAGLTEALAQQTATSEILRVISSSLTDVQPVFDMIARRAVRLCDGRFCAVFQFDGEFVHLVAHHGLTPEEVEAYRQAFPAPAGQDSAIGRAILNRAIAHIPDVDEDAAYGGASVAQVPTFRSIVAVPMLREGSPLGTIAVARAETGGFPDQHIDLLQTFAAQSVIAIENARLFQELQARTRELTRSVEELKALGEVSQAVSSSLDLQTVLTTIVARAAELSGSHGGTMYEFDETTETFHVRATHRIAPEHLEALRASPIRLGQGAVGHAGAARAPVQVADIRDEREFVAPQTRQILIQLGFRSLLALPLLREQRLLGGLVVWRTERGSFSSDVVNVLQTFAAQSVLAIQNARLFQEVETKGRELEIASKHKSQFLANMSHELRTPLNAVLGYVELILDNIFGEVPEAIRDILERTRSNGRHLLRLINDVLDLSKIEAGQLTLSLAEYSMRDVIHAVCAAVEALASEKKLTLKVTASPDLPPGRGDEGRITQVLLNLVGNAIKFTDVGEVRIDARASDGLFAVSVSDTGPGISEADQRKIFEEFQQADSSSTRPKGGTGLGLAIAKRIIEMHGGRIWVEASPGEGSTFSFTVPVRVERQAGRT